VTAGSAGRSAPQPRRNSIRNPPSAGDPSCQPLGGPLIGRAAELSTLVGRWTAAAGRHGALCLVRGSSKTGKSRLADELAAVVGA
jgi:hypothetical protein